MTIYQPGIILLGNYRIERLIGRGAFAEVYLAVHLKLDTARALKILRRASPGLEDTEFQDIKHRFLLEAQLSAKLNHPNLIRVYDFGENDDTLILVMEPAMGGDLALRLGSMRENDQKFTIPQVVFIAKEIASGLAAIHENDIVHRDLKPSNILFDGLRSR
jgi:eukaryotic-like serine/threonine-protein kinase